MMLLSVATKLRLVKGSDGSASQFLSPDMQVLLQQLFRSSVNHAVSRFEQKAFSAVSLIVFDILPFFLLHSAVDGMDSARPLLCRGSRTDVVPM